MLALFKERNVELLVLCNGNIQKIRCSCEMTGSRQEATPYITFCQSLVGMVRCKVRLLGKNPLVCAVIVAGSCWYQRLNSLSSIFGGGR